MNATPARTPRRKKPAGYVDGYGADRAALNVKPIVVKSPKSKEPAASSKTAYRGKAVAR